MRGPASPKKIGAIAAFLLVAGVSLVTSSAAATTSTDWPAYERNNSHTSAIFGDPAVTTSNAGSPHKAWAFKAGAATKQGQPGPGVSRTVQLYRESDGQLLGSVPETGKTFAQPVFAHGMLYVAGEDGTLTAYMP